jgi:hypothetical protein
MSKHRGNHCFATGGNTGLDRGESNHRGKSPMNTGESLGRRTLQCPRVKIALDMNRLDRSKKWEVLSKPEARSEPLHFTECLFPLCLLVKASLREYFKKSVSRC